MSLHIERRAGQIEIVVTATPGGHAALLAVLVKHTPEPARQSLRLRSRGEVLRVSLPSQGELADASLLGALRRSRQSTPFSAALP